MPPFLDMDDLDFGLALNGEDFFARRTEKQFVDEQKKFRTKTIQTAALIHAHTLRDDRHEYM